MKPFISYSILAALAACGAASAQVTAKTTPVGYVSLGVTDGSAAVPANTDVAISIPLQRSTEFSGAVTSVSGSVISFSSASFEADEFSSDSSTPYICVVTSGDGEGLMALVTATSTDSLTVSVVGGGDLSAVVAGDMVSVSKAWTLSSFFSSDLPAGTRVLAFSGTTAGENLASNLQYVWSGSSWVQLVGGSGTASNTILYPGESFILRSGATAIESLIVSGEVPTYASGALISKLGTGNQDNRISFFSPVDQTIGSLGLGFTAGDRLLAFNNASTGVNKAASEILVWNGTDWIGLLGVSGIQTDAYTIKAGVGYVYRRVSTAPVGDIDWTATPSYVSEL
ncbi:TIGR02597 family protein [Luteolibacter pohnpeiensis]|uniref:TIGR02597 family protein n=1 Tax=Luteolibacter pohnpeiensis TaxID=454153 RepID=A0A934S6F6_9BACT|nr:TIGR02597 family protein [Luteolibacter pohnpeiensis]MBK1883496.1 TIGR02597 family protein [Luteolibacter pohnpeiensis]